MKNKKGSAYARQEVVNDVVYVVIGILDENDNVESSIRLKADVARQYAEMVKKHASKKARTA